MSETAPASGLPQLSKYELIEEIGHGGMATVYRALDKRLGREVAVKIIHRHLRENAEVGTRFIAEARAAAKLHHPGIVEVFDVSTEEDSERFLVVELLRGTTLRKVLVDNRQMPAEVGASIVIELCEALEHAHESSIIHRDIKPENVLVELPSDRAAVNITPTPPLTRARSLRASGSDATRRSPDESGAVPVVAADPMIEPAKQGGDKADRESSKRVRAADVNVVIKLTDFGIAKILDAQGVTSTGQVLGSPAHMAPEQIEGGDVDARTDVFGLGVLMYECLVGHLPFEGKNPAQVLRKVLEGIYTAADRERPKVGGRWSRIVAQSLARDPTERTASPSALAEQIRAELKALDIADPRAEIAAYFADRSGYTEALSKRLVPCLVARAEAARKAGDVAGAAADFNRALAFCPNDLVLLKRIGSLHGAAGRRQIMRGGAAILAGSVILGLGAFGIARAVKAKGPHGAPLPVDTASPSASPNGAPSLSPSGTALIVAEPPSSAGSTPSGLPSSGAKQPRPSSAGAPSASASAVVSASGVRNVKFILTPPGAKLMVEGQPVNWFSGTVPLTVGAHHVTVFVEGSKCCKALETSAMVQPAPADKPDQPQSVPLAMEILPASVTLTGAPPNGQYSCPSINLSGFSGSTLKVKLSEPVWTGKCQFTASADKPARSGAVVLRAGEMNAIPWPP